VQLIRLGPKAIVAIGGGLIGTKGTAGIDREIIRLTNKKHPRVLLLPTASSDAAWRIIAPSRLSMGSSELSARRTRRTLIGSTGMAAKRSLNKFRRKKQSTPIESLFE
jgi:hypothetical protein